MSLAISSTSNATLKYANSSLEKKRSHHYKAKQALNPMFEGLVDQRLRVLLEVIIDSDALPGGVPGLGLQKVATHMSTLSNGVLDDQSLTTQ